MVAHKIMSSSTIFNIVELNQIFAEKSHHKMMLRKVPFLQYYDPKAEKCFKVSSKLMFKKITDNCLKNCQNLKCPKFDFCTKTSFQRNEHKLCLQNGSQPKNFRNHEFFRNMQIQKQRSKGSKFDKSKVIN